MNDALTPHPSLFSRVRESAEKYTAPQLDVCLIHAIAGEPNSCGLDTSDDSINILAKAEWVRGKMDNDGWSAQMALRDLARRERELQTGGAPNPAPVPNSAG